MTMPQAERERLVGKVFGELRRAEDLHAGFPADPLHALAIAAEELGELTQAVLQWTYEGGRIKRVETEAIQLAAMALQFVLNLPNYTPRPDGLQVGRGSSVREWAEEASNVSNS